MSDRAEMNAGDRGSDSNGPGIHRLVEVVALVKTYPSGDKTLRVLDGTQLSVAAGERVAVLGASGVGKSTLLHLLGGLDRPDSGTITFRGQAIGELPEDALASYRNAEIGFVFQFFQLLPEFTALENVMMPMLIGRQIEPARRRATELLDEVGLGDRGHHFPGQLSGGERQRVAIARALSRDPSLLLADEPTGNLDIKTGMRVMELFARVQGEHGAAIIMATHNPALVEGFDRVLEMQPGGLLAPRRPDSG
jgi:lipoprotein-releasing system ATP-binding protein